MVAEERIAALEERVAALEGRTGVACERAARVGHA